MHAQLGIHARRQHSLFTYRQALEAGITADTIERNVARGVWQELEPQVYRALPAARPSLEQRLHAKVLSTGGIAFGRSATWLYGLTEPPPSPEVVVERARRNRLRSVARQPHGTTLA